MPWLFEENLFRMDYQVQDLVNGIRQIRNGFVAHSMENWVFWFCFISGLLLVIGLALWIGYQSKKNGVKKTWNDPDLLFWSLLNQLQLPDSDKKLLHEMTAEARLAHPASALLSPHTLDWARNLWIQEKGNSAIPLQKLRRISEISVLLFDHYPPQLQSNSAYSV
ncbi:MAG: hypothetical protein BWY71_01674 [Planctomycetes bacterium ADurb.Bin412]|nr:MAG: hypothetical protein BWY71_01674 [Planctomycetes bacterium ADurb.Bin412]